MRHKNDFYETHAEITRGLLPHLPKSLGFVLEPCVGDGAIFRSLIDNIRNVSVVTNDIDASREAYLSYDATKADLWERLSGIDWVITNPPYNAAAFIVPRAIKTARVGVAMLLRISFLEPCQNREWLRDTPPTRLIVVGDPRPSFRLNKHGKRGTDSATVAWMIWDKGVESPIKFITNEGKRW